MTATDTAPEVTEAVEDTPTELATFFEAEHNLNEAIGAIAAASPDETVIATLKTRHGRVVLVQAAPSPARHQERHHSHGQRRVRGQGPHGSCSQVAARLGHRGRVCRGER
jgi:hypothetical protein